MESRWEIQSLSPQQQAVRDRLAAELNINKAAAALLVHRGLLTAEAARTFIRPSLDQLHDPFLMRDMDKAVSRLTSAVEHNEKILIYGDYDVDGTTAVALVYTYLSSFYQNLDFYIPDRYTEGYGISFKGVDYAAEQGCRLIIALDCGIRSDDKVSYARERGIDFIICDHHLPGNTIPDAVAVLDAKRKDNTYPFNELSGCGVGFKLMQAYAQQHNRPFEQLIPLLSLTAMAVASDIVPVVDENRLLAHFGILQLNNQPSVGMQQLIQLAGIEQGKLQMYDLQFKIGPRINACGRIRSGREAVRLLITTDPQEAAEISNLVNENNEKRRSLDHDITDAALEQLRQDPDNDTHCSTVVCGEHWHKGVLGIVASRLTETYYRPTIVLSEEDGMVSGSARSAGGFDIYAAIDSCNDLLTNFGGHLYAAGLSMKAENLPEFKRRFEQYVSAHILPEQKQPIIQVEEELDFQDITNRFYDVIRCLQPFGPGNPSPVFVTYNVCNYRYTKAVGKQNEHLKLDVTDRTGYMQGIAFCKGSFALALQNGNNADICYELQQNTFNGKTTLQMMVQDIKMR